MGKRTWTLQLDGRSHQFDVEHGYWSGTTVLRADGETILRAVPGFGGFADSWAGPSEYSAQMGRHEIRVRVTPNVGYALDLLVDGRSASSGAFLPPLPQPPDDAFHRIAKLGASISIIAVPYTLAVTAIFGRFAPEWGPRWFAATDLALASGVLPLMAGMGIYLVSNVRKRSAVTSRGVAGRAFSLLLGLVSLWVASSTALEVPLFVQDVIRTPETRTVEVLATVERARRAPAIRTADGATYEWVWAFGLYAYPRVEPGNHEIVITPVTHRIVRIRDVR